MIVVSIVEVTGVRIVLLLGGRLHGQQGSVPWHIFLVERSCQRLLVRVTSQDAVHNGLLVVIHKPVILVLEVLLGLFPGGHAVEESDRVESGVLIDLEQSIQHLTYQRDLLIPVRGQLDVLLQSRFADLSVGLVYIWRVAEVGSR